jgi:hypothetical protein
MPSIKPLNSGGVIHSKARVRTHIGWLACSLASAEKCRDALAHLVPELQCMSLHEKEHIMWTKRLAGALAGLILLALSGCGTTHYSDYGYPTKAPGVGTTDQR